MKTNVVFALLSALLLTACGVSIRTAPEFPADELKVLEPHLTTVIGPNGAMEFDNVPLEGGQAFVFNRKAFTKVKDLPCFWVKGQEAFTVNEAARGASQGLNSAPANITVEAIEKAMSKDSKRIL